MHAFIPHLSRLFSSVCQQPEVKHQRTHGWSSCVWRHACKKSQLVLHDLQARTSPGSLWPCLYCGGVKGGLSTQSTVTCALFLPSQRFRPKRKEGLFFEHLTHPKYRHWPWESDKQDTDGGGGCSSGSCPCPIPTEAPDQAGSGLVSLSSVSPAAWAKKGSLHDCVCNGRVGLG